jgi:hypothetical protein
MLKVKQHLAKALIASQIARHWHFALDIGWADLLCLPTDCQQLALKKKARYFLIGNFVYCMWCGRFRLTTQPVFYRKSFKKLNQ